MTHDDETVERVARAIYEAIIVGEEMHHDAFDDIPEPYRRQLLFEARAALSAMPERELLREALSALEPFVRFEDKGLRIIDDEKMRDDLPISGFFNDWNFEPFPTYGDLRRARAAADKIRAALTQEKQT